LRLSGRSCRTSKDGAETPPQRRHLTQLDERMARLEADLRDSSERHGRELEAARGSTREFHSHVEGERSARTEHLSSLEERLERLESVLGETHEQHALEVHKHIEGERDARESHHAAVEDRMQSLGELLADTSGRLRDLEGAHSELRDRHERAVRQSGAYEEHRTVFEERLRELESLRRGHEELQHHVGAERSAREEHHATVQERLARLEASAGETSERQAAALEAACRRVQDCHEHIKSEKDAQRHKYATIEQRFQDLEKVIGACMQKLSNEDAEGPDRRPPSAAVGPCTPALEERIAHLEKLISHSAEKLDGNSEDLEQIHRRLRDISRQIEEEARAREQHQAAAEQTLLERVQALIEETVRKRTRELQAACERSFSSSLRSEALRSSSEERRVRPSPGQAADPRAGGSAQQEDASSSPLEAAGYRQVEGRLRRLQSKLAKAAEDRGVSERATAEGQLLDTFVTMPASQAARMFVEHRN